MTAAQTAAAHPLWHFFMPPLFVLLWASGFVVTNLGVAFAEPFTFLLYRFVIVAALLAGAVSLLGWLIRRGEASRVASMFYLVPPMAALGSWLLFKETLGPPLARLGMAITVVGVALVARR